MSPPKKKGFEIEYMRVGGNAPRDELDVALDRLFPPGEWVSIDLSPETEDEIFEATFKNMPMWFHYEIRNSEIQPRSLEDKKKLAASLSLM